MTSEVFGISDDPNSVCLQDRLVYTCTTPDVLRWTVGAFQLPPFVLALSGTNVGNTQTSPQLRGVVANLTNIDGTSLTSTLMIPSAGMVMNESVITCEGSSGNMNSTVLLHRGGIPGCCVWARSRIVGLPVLV